MRKKLSVALAAVLVLALAGIALAASTQVETGKIKFNKSKPGKTTAIDSTFKVSDPGNTTPGQVGKPTRQINRVDINFPKGIVFDYKVRPTCKETIASLIKAKCKKALLATGTTKVDGRGGVLGLVSGKLTAYNAVNPNTSVAKGKYGLRIVVSAPGTLADNNVLSPKLMKNKLVTQLPPALKAVNAYLTDFHLKIPVIKKKIKHKTHYYATLPKKCPKNKRFDVTVKYYFDGGGTFTTPPTKNKCKKK